MDTSADRVYFLKVPLDIVPPEDFPNIVSWLVPPKDEKKSRNVVLLSLWDLLKARRNNDYRKYIMQADLVVPISKSIVSGVKFITGKKIYRYMPFHFVISLLTALERKEYPLYLLGGKSKILKKAERNIFSTYPGLKIVGRHEGRIRKREAPMVMEAIRKSSPSLLLAGKGIKGGELWIARNSERLNSGLRLWCSDLFDVFAEKKRRPSDSVFDRGLESLGYCFKRPILFFRFFAYLRYKWLLLFYKIFRH